MEKELVVTGHGKVSVKPDVLEIHLTVSAEHPRSLKGAIELQAAKTAALLPFLRASVAEKDIQTTGYHYGALTTYDEKKQKNVVRGYQATQNFRVRASLENASDLLEGVDHFAEVNGVSLVVRDPTAAKEEAVNLAIADALACAKRRAAKLDVRLGSIHYFTEGQTTRPRVVMRAMAARAESAGAVPEIAAGETEIAADVTVVYGIEG